MDSSGFSERARIYVLLLLYILIAYLPVSSFLFALKNDALTDNFPPKYFFTAALRAGELPLWNPYINFGLPAYADPGFAFWNPITWLFGLLGYNFYTLSIEILFYTWLGTIFMYDLCRFLGNRLLTAFIIASMFGSCGFFIGSLQFFNFITAAAFIPLAIKFYLQWQYTFSTRNTIKCALAIFFILAGGHPAIPIGMLYFLVSFNLVQQLADYRQISLKKLAIVVSRNAFLVIITALFALPIIYSSYEIIPLLTRNEIVTQTDHLDTGFSLLSYISFLFPFSTAGDSSCWDNSILMRNGYFSLLGFMLFLWSLIRLKSTQQKVFLVTGICFLFLSAGGWIKVWVYPNLPLLQFIRTNGEFRVFAIILFLLLAAGPLNALLDDRNSENFKRLLFLIIILTSIVLLVSLYYIFPFNESLLPENFKALRTIEKLKWLLYNTPFPTKLLLNAICVLGLTTGSLTLTRKITPQRLILLFVLADTILMAWLNLPVTGVQSKSVSDMQNLVKQYPKGIPIPRLEPLSMNSESGQNLVIGPKSYYSKQPGTPEFCDYPTVFKSTFTYFNSVDKNSLPDRPFVFLEDTEGVVTVSTFRSQGMKIATLAHKPGRMVILQNNYQNWHALIDGQETPIHTYKHSFISIQLPEGSHNIELKFKASALNKIVWIWIIYLAITGGIYAWNPGTKSSFPS